MDNLLAERSVARTVRMLVPLWEANLVAHLDAMTAARMGTMLVAWKAGYWASQKGMRLAARKERYWAGKSVDPWETLTAVL